MYSNNAVGNSLTYSNEITLTVISLPTISTTVISSIAFTTANSGGTITNDGGSNISVRGICWGTSTNPTIALTTKTNNGSGTGAFLSNITGLIVNTTYYVRAYATNSAGTAYGNEVSFTTANALTDIDGNNYQLVTICNQTWTKSNLNVSRYRNGDIIPQVTNSAQWGALTSGAWCYHPNNSNNVTTYGKLYNWYAVNDPRGLVPVGYHIPSSAEWSALRTCLGGTTAGSAMKEAGTSHWNSPNSATNSSGFTALPGAYRTGAAGTSTGTWGQVGSEGYFWSLTGGVNFPGQTAFMVTLTSTSENLNEYESQYTSGYSVRCLKN